MIETYPELDAVVVEADDVDELEAALTPLSYVTAVELNPTVEAQADTDTRMEFQTCCSGGGGGQPMEVSLDNEEEQGTHLQPRPSIYIDREVGATGFIVGEDPISGDPIHNVAMGVSHGEGSAENPYVIRNWTISPDQGYAINIVDTEAHVLIENVFITRKAFTGTANCALLEGCKAGNGILLEGAKNVTISNVEVVRVDHALHFPGVEDVTVDTLLANRTVGEPALQGVDEGVLMTDSSNVAFSNLSILGINSPIDMAEVDDVQVDQSRLMGFTGNVDSEIEDSSNVTISRSRILDGGIDLLGTKENKVVENVTLTHNRFKRGWKAIDVGLGNYTDIEVCGNSFRQYAGDLEVVLIGPGEDIHVEGNRFQENDPDGSLLAIGGSDDVIHRNLFVDNTVGDYGIVADSQDAKISYNHVEDSGGAVISGDGTNATNNWWDDPQGPNVTGMDGPGDGEPLRINGDHVTFDPWLEAPP